MELALGWQQIAFALFALLAGCTVYSATGFGIAMVSMPIMLLAVGDPQTAVVVVNSAGVGAGVLIAIQARKDIPYREILPIAIAGGLGVPVGVVVLKFADPTIIRIGIATLILLLAALSLKEYRGNIPFAGALGIGVGFIVGLTLAAFAVGGPLIVLFLLARKLQRFAVRAAMAFFLLLVASVGVVGYALGGLYTGERLTLIGIVLIPSFIGFALGALLIRHMNERIFRYVVLGIIVLSSGAVLWPEVAKIVRAAGAFDGNLWARNFMQFNWV